MGFRGIRSGNVAARFAEMWLEREPDNVQALICHGVCIGELGNFTEAKLHLQKALQLDPANTLAKDNAEVVERELNDAHNLHK